MTAGNGEQPPAAFSGRTAWARHLETPLRNFLRTETGSAAFLLAATLAALAWANIDSSSYERVWHTLLSIRIGGSGVSQDLRGWLNNGLMTFFFFVVGLEARREFDLGELRERRRFAVPLVAGIGGTSLSPSTWPRTRGVLLPTAGARRCRRTRRSHSGCWRWSGRASPTACEPSS
jgi:hypothetical protein